MGSTITHRHTRTHTHTHTHTHIYIYIYMKKISGKWINQTLTTDLVVIFRFLFNEELLQTKEIYEFFLHFSNQGNRKNNGENAKRYKGGKGSKNKRQTRKEKEREIDIGLSDGVRGYSFRLRPSG